LILRIIKQIMPNKSSIELMLKASNIIAQIEEIMPH
jgi:hypothetical protein